MAKKKTKSKSAKRAQKGSAAKRRPKAAKPKAVKKAKKTKAGNKPAVKKPRKGAGAEPKVAKQNAEPKPARKKKSKIPLRSTRNRLTGRRRGVGSAEDLRASTQEESPKKRNLQRGGLTKRDLAGIKKDLIEQRQRIIDAMRRNQGIEIVGGDVGDEADQAGLNIERELQFELSDNERTTLDQIEGALRKMEKGTFGLCEQCRLSIETLRIKALPFARYCIACQNTSEKATATLI